MFLNKQIFAIYTDELITNEQISCIDKTPALYIKRVIISCDNFLTICYKVNKLNSYKKRNDGTFQKNI